MRSLILTLSLALALPLMPTMASANSHNCPQLRLNVVNAVPPTLRNLPYDSLRCSAIGQLHLIVTSNRQSASNRMSRDIRQVFRRNGLIR